MKAHVLSIKFSRRVEDGTPIVSYHGRIDFDWRSMMDLVIWYEPAGDLLKNNKITYTLLLYHILRNKSA